MSEELKEMRIVVEQKGKECAEMLVYISKITASAVTKQEVAQAKEGELSELTRKIATKKKEAEAAPAAALLALEAAAQALNSLRRDDIIEIRSCVYPPPVVQQVCECVVLLKGLPDVSWKGAKSVLSDPEFLGTLLALDKDSLRTKQCRQVKAYYHDPAFHIDEAKKVSLAAAGLMQWVKAMTNYHDVVTKTNPLMEAVRKAELHQVKMQKELDKIKQEVQELSEMREGLRDSKATSEKEELTEQAYHDATPTRTPPHTRMHHTHTTHLKTNTPDTRHPTPPHSHRDSQAAKMERLLDAAQRLSPGES